MKTWVRRSLNAGALAAGALLVAGAPAHADAVTTGNTGVLNGNQVMAPIQAPINICGIAIGVLGSATASCDGGAYAVSPSDTTLISHGNVGALNGNQVYAPVRVPVNACGIGASVAGSAVASCVGGSWAKEHGTKESISKPPYKPGKPHKPGSGKHHRPDVVLVTHDNVGVGNGNQVYIPIQIPINLCGIAIGVLGNATASCVGGAYAR